jgi:hypothetical protein
VAAVEATGAWGGATIGATIGAPAVASAVGSVVDSVVDAFLRRTYGRVDGRRSWDRAGGFGVSMKFVVPGIAAVGNSSAKVRATGARRAGSV